MSFYGPTGHSSFFELNSIKSGESIEFVENYIWRLVALKMKITKNTIAFQ